MRVAMLLIVVCTLGGCRSVTDPARHHELRPGTIYRLDFDATRRNAVIIPKNVGQDSVRSDVFVLAEPSPDVAMASVVELGGKLNYSGISAEASAKITESIIELGKRTQAIMFLRELMYRTSEQYINGAINHDDLMKLNYQIIAAAKDIALAEKISATAKLLYENEMPDGTQLLDKSQLQELFTPAPMNND